MSEQKLIRLTYFERNLKQKDCKQNCVLSTISNIRERSFRDYGKKQEQTSLKKVLDDDITEVKNTLYIKEGKETTTTESVNIFVEMQQSSLAPAPQEIDDEDNSKTRGNEQCISELTSTNTPCENCWNCSGTPEVHNFGFSL
ncbi:Hypothetical predicted protein [Mytilus galloprovincialis]|uniref:Uncharacterized protein n=1 Tax=Mytilus galloprovincialis TaxID=29158 RepID=A0A8B6FU19_MYTGA|nr:Hypothetical predicted protein [Mytilus galloprovincialis]